MTMYVQIFKVTLDRDAMDNFVFCLAAKKTATRLMKDMTDLVTEKRVVV